jgi:hypothetical protein
MFWPAIPTSGALQAPEEEVKNAYRPAPSGIPVTGRLIEKRPRYGV